MVRPSPFVLAARAAVQRLTPRSPRPKQSYNSSHGGGYGGGSGGYGSGGGGWGGGGGGGGDRMSNLGGSLRQIDWGTQRLEKFEKNFYVEDKRVVARSDREIEEFRRAKEMRVSFFFFFPHVPRCSNSQISRCKAETSQDPSQTLMRLASPSTSSTPSSNKAFQSRRPFNARHGPWL